MYLEHPNYFFAKTTRNLIIEFKEKKNLIRVIIILNHKTLV